MDELWNARHKKLQDELKLAVANLLDHTGAPGMLAKIDDGEIYFAAGPLELIQDLVEAALSPDAENDN